MLVLCPNRMSSNLVGTVGCWGDQVFTIYCEFWRRHGIIQVMTEAERCWSLIGRDKSLISIAS